MLILGFFAACTLISDAEIARKLGPADSAAQGSAPDDSAGRDSASQDSAGDTATDPPADLGFVSIPASTFLMGCTTAQTGCDIDETEHSVTLQEAYWLGVAEVTQHQFHTVMGYNPANFTDCGATCPVETVTWHEAAAYANAVSRAEGRIECYLCDGSGTTVTCEPPSDPYACEGYRLPTEAEWEGAARCGTDLVYAGSDTYDEVAWTLENSGLVAHPQAQLLPNECGLYDMSGNVWEWTGDWYEEEYGTEWESDPTGPTTGTVRVFRGGAWGYSASGARVSFRMTGLPSQSGALVGFRLARTDE